MQEFKAGDRVAFVMDKRGPTRLAMHENPFGVVLDVKSRKDAMTLDTVPFVKSRYTYKGGKCESGLVLNDHVVERYRCVGEQETSPITWSQSRPLKCWFSRSRDHPGWKARFDYAGGEYEVVVVAYDDEAVYT